jgi:small subunit ribosomal protein S17e
MVKTPIIIKIVLYREAMATNPGDFMGNVRPTYIKRIAIDLVKKHTDRFTPEFQENKKLVSELTDVTSDKLRNRIAGYVTTYRKYYEP